MLIQAVIFNLGATKALHRENSRGAKATLPAQSCIVDFLDQGRAVPVPLKSKGSCIFIAVCRDFFLSGVSPAGTSKTLSFPKAQKHIYWGESTG